MRFLRLALAVVAAWMAACTAARQVPPPTALYLTARPVPDLRLGLELGQTSSDLDLVLTHARTGVPITQPVSIQIQLTLLERDLEPVTCTARRVADGHYVAPGSALAEPGLWRLSVFLQGEGLDGMAEFPVYRDKPGSAFPPNDPAALEFLRASEAAMNRLRSLRTLQQLNDGRGGLAVTRFEYYAPDALHMSVQNGGESISIGRAAYDREPGSDWASRQRITPFAFPRFQDAQEARNVVWGRQETLGGETLRIVRYRFPGPAGQPQRDTHMAQWISTRDYRLVQSAMVGPAHYMLESYFDHDSPGISISAPVTP